MDLSGLLKGGSFALKTFRGAIVLFIVLILVHLFIGTFIIVDGLSMDPTLKDKEIIIINKLSRNAPLKRGDIVIFHYPGDSRKNYIKRVIGLPGEKVVIKDGRLFINGKALKEEYLPPEFITETPDQTEFNINEGEYILLGDNRPGSNDSRYFGRVEQRFIIGTAVFSFYPSFQVFSRPYYPLADDK